MKTNLGESTDISALQNIIALKGKRVVDVGCGQGEFAALIAGLGAQVTGIEPDPVQAAKNRDARPLDQLELIEASADGLPLADASQDLLVFRFSLHHIPEALYPAVFKEAARVLKRGGQLYVMEPLAEGLAQYVMELFHDETEVRRVAQNALHKLCPAYFKPVASYTYSLVRHYDDFAAYVSHYGHLSYNSYGVDRVNNEQVKHRFMQAKNPEGGFTLRQPVKTDLFTKKDL